MSEARAESGGENRFGRTSELRLRAEAAGGRTVLAEQYATMPFRVMRPFPLPRAELVGAARLAAPDVLADPVQVTLMCASAGLMAGDEQAIAVDVGSGAALRQTSQSFEKIHRMEAGGSASRRVRLRVAEGGYLDFAQQPQIPFAGSDFRSATEVELAGPGAALVYEELLSCGRAASGERFGYRRYANRVDVRVADAPVYADNALFLPEGDPELGLPPMGLEGAGFFEGFTHLANLVLVNVGVGEAGFDAACDLLREAAAAGGDDRVAGGVTRLASGDVAVRLLGFRAQRLTDLLAAVRGLYQKGQNPPGMYEL